MIIGNNSTTPIKKLVDVGVGPVMRSLASNTRGHIGPTLRSPSTKLGMPVSGRVQSPLNAQDKIYGHLVGTLGIASSEAVRIVNKFSGRPMRSSLGHDDVDHLATAKNWAHADYHRSEPQVVTRGVR